MLYKRGRGRIVELSWSEDDGGEIDYAYIRGTETRPDGTKEMRLVHAEIRDVTTAVAAAAANLQSLEVDYEIAYTPNENAPEGVPTGELILGEQCDAVFTALVPVVPEKGTAPVWRRVEAQARPSRPTRAEGERAEARKPRKPRAQVVDEPLAEWERILLGGATERPERHLRLVPNDDCPL